MAEEQGSKVVITIDRPGHVTLVEVKFDDTLSREEISALAEAMRDMVKAVRLCAASKRRRIAEPEPVPEAKDETYGGIVLDSNGRDTCPHPGCGKIYVSSCKCSLSDRSCEDGHQWHYHGDKVVLGPSPHARKGGSNFVCPLC